RYKAIVEQSPCGVLIGDTNGDIIDVSERFCQMIKLPPEGILGKNICDLFTPNSVKEKPFDYVNVDTGQIIGNERELRCSDGTVKIVEMYSCAITKDMYQAVVLDITERKIFEGQLTELRKQNEELLEEEDCILRSSKELTIIYSADFKIKKVFFGMDSRFSKFYKAFRDKNEMLEDLLKIIRINNFEPLIIQTIGDVLDSGSSETVLREITLGGVQFFIEARFVPMSNFVAVVVTDVTQHELAKNDLLKATQKAEESERLKTALLGNLSHELRTPMNGIIGFADLLYANETDDVKREYLRNILDSSNQLLGLISDVIEMSKLEAGVVKVKNEIVGVKKLVSNIIDSIRPLGI
ncbi:MAG: PAS domain S-box protein, partial [Bacteroidales bacterium]|nr:PAS domain S-box protein [Bacteroidales bacterium]